MITSMRNMYRTEILLIGLFYLAALFFFTACEQEEAVVELGTAPGGGTVTTYKAYTIEGVTAADIHGRVVFYKDNSDYTLVQVSLYNTEEEAVYPTELLTGDADEDTPDVLIPLYTIDGSTGEFAPSKFYVIKDKTFFAGLTELDAHVKIMFGSDLVSKGNIGKNATPVAEAE